MEERIEPPLAALVENTATCATAQPGLATPRTTTKAQMQNTQDAPQANAEPVATKGLKNKIKAAVQMGRDAVAKAAEVADKLTPTNDGVTGLIKIPVVLGAVVATAVVSTAAAGVYAAAAAIRSGVKGILNKTGARTKSTEQQNKEKEDQRNKLAKKVKKEDKKNIRG